MKVTLQRSGFDNLNPLAGVINDKLRDRII